MTQHRKYPIIRVNQDFIEEEQPAHINLLYGGRLMAIIYKPKIVCATLRPAMVAADFQPVDVQGARRLARAIDVAAGIAARLNKENDL